MIVTVGLSGEEGECKDNNDNAAGRTIEGN
jgi:hypothetical protein